MPVIHGVAQHPLPHILFTIHPFTHPTPRAGRGHVHDAGGRMATLPPSATLRKQRPDMPGAISCVVDNPSGTTHQLITRCARCGQLGLPGEVGQPLRSTPGAVDGCQSKLRCARGVDFGMPGAGVLQQKSRKPFSASSMGKKDYVKGLRRPLHLPPFPSQLAHNTHHTSPHIPSPLLSPLSSVGALPCQWSHVRSDCIAIAPSPSLFP